jgi:hypothetical protein
LGGGPRGDRWHRYDHRHDHRHDHHGSGHHGSGHHGTNGPTVSIQVDGQEYTEAAQYDSSGNAVAQVHLSDGDTVLAGDTNHDGQADVAEIEDSTGQVVDVQYVDPSTGEWVDAGPPQSGS